MYAFSKGVKFCANEVRWQKKNFISKIKSDRENHQKKVMAKGLPKVKPLAGVKNIVLVCSGKGGVGKSTTAVNLAAAMKVNNPKQNVGLLDADVFGPSIPLMMNLHDMPLLNEENLMEPLVNYGVKCMSMGFLIDEKSPVIWRGLMVMQALEKLLRQVHWNKIDCLIVDTPPGTGDTQLSLVQNLPISGVILVSTPTLAAINITRKGAVMFKKLNIPIIGIVENMSSVTCPTCSNDVKIFGNAVESLAQEFTIPVLKQIPLEQDISNSGDIGVPIVIGKPNSKESSLYVDLAKAVNDFIFNKL